MDLPTLPTYLFEPNLRGLLSFFIAFLLPFLVALVTKQSWSSSTRALVLIGFAAVKSVVEAYLVGGADFNLAVVVYTVALNAGIAVLAYFGGLRKTSTLAKAQNSLNKDPV